MCVIAFLGDAPCQQHHITVSHVLERAVLPLKTYLQKSDDRLVVEDHQREGDATPRRLYTSFATREV
jgi:hypothetical protein